MPCRVIPGAKVAAELELLHDMVRTKAFEQIAELKGDLEDLQSEKQDLEREKKEMELRFEMMALQFDRTKAKGEDNRRGLDPPEGRELAESNERNLSTGSSGVNCRPWSLHASVTSLNMLMHFTSFAELQVHLPPNLSLCHTHRV